MHLVWRGLFVWGRDRMKRFFRNLFWDLAAYTEWWPWLSSWFDTWSILCDEEAMKAIHDIEKWADEGTLDQHTVPLSKLFDEWGITQEELDAVPEPEVDRHGNLMFPPCPKPKAINEDTGREVSK